MKQKKCLIPVCAIAGVLILYGAFLWYLKANSLTLSVNVIKLSDLRARYGVSGPSLSKKSAYQQTFSCKDDKIGSKG